MEIKNPEYLNRPYFTCELSLEQDLNLLAIAFSRASAQLLKEINAHPQLTKKYRLEVEFDHRNGVAKFQICLDPLSWFDVYLEPKGYMNAYNIAQDYIGSVYERFPSNSTTDEIIKEPVNTLKEKAFDICKFFIDGKCKNGFNCGKSGLNDCSYSKVVTNRIFYYDEYSTDYPHPKILCKTLVKTNDGRKPICGQYVPDDLRINDLSNDSPDKVKKYVICLRRELLQELLLIPYPPSNENEEHLNNEKLATSTDIWESILKLHKRLSFYQVGFNFGAWESGNAFDYYSLGCHGHAHLCFDSGTWDQLKKESSNWPRDKLISARLNECKYPTPNYLLRNCKDLENYPQYLRCELNEKNRQTSEDPVENYYEQISIEWREEEKRKRQLEEERKKQLEEEHNNSD